METGKLINQISHKLRRRAWHFQSELGLGGAQGTILNYILVESEKHPVYQKDIEDEFGLRASTVTEILKSLEKKCLINRIPDEKDSRCKKIIFTENAKDTEERLKAIIEESEETLLNGISEREKRQFIKTAEKMLENLG